MSVSFSKIEGAAPVPAPPEPRREGARGPGSAGFAGDLSRAAAVSSPPAEVSAEVREAARAAARLHELGRELRFDHGPDGRLRVELRNRDGGLLRAVPTAEIFDFAAGRATS